MSGHKIEANLNANNFNPIRLLLAYLVIFSHSYDQSGLFDREPLRVASGGQDSLGPLAVSFFFMISGFLITRSWISSRSFFQFLIKRIRRIYPGFIVASLWCLFVAGPLGSADRVAYWQQLRPWWFVLSTLWLKPELPMAFANLPVGGVNDALWSIPWEFGCYLTIPIVSLLGFLRYRRLALAGFVVMMAIFVVKNYFLAQLPFPGRIATAFTVGQLFYLYRDTIRYRTRYFAASCVMMVVATVAWPLQAYPLFLPIFGAYILFYLGFANVAPLALLGRLAGKNDISYGVYLYGWPAQQLSILYLGLGLGPKGHFVVSAMFATLLGLLSWLFVERVFLNQRPSHAVSPVADSPSRS